MSLSIKEAMIKVAFKQDGVDHVLLAPFGETKIGKYASMNWRRAFFIPQLGEFLSPQSFVSWLHYGDETQRHSGKPTRLPYLDRDTQVLYQQALYLAKWYQLSSLHGALVKQSTAGGVNLLDLPWAEYRIHANGLKEFPQNQKNADIIKALVKLNIEHGNHSGLGKIESEKIIPGFELKKLQGWIDQVVRKNFNLEPVQPKTKPNKPQQKVKPEGEDEPVVENTESGVVEEVAQA